MGQDSKNKNFQIINRLISILKYEKKEIYSIYIYAIFSGLVQLSLPLGIQSIISFVMGGSISTSLVLLIAFVISGVIVSGLLRVNQMKITERIQQQIFTRYSLQYAHTIPRLNLLDVNNYYLPELTNRFFDAVSLQKSISKLVLDIPAISIQIIFGLTLLSFYHPVFIFFGILLLSILLGILRYTGNKGLHTSLVVSDYKYKIAGYMQELARLVFNLKFRRDKEMHLRETDKFVSGYLRARTEHFSILLFQYWTLVVFKVVIVSAMLIVGSYLLVNQQLNIGQFIAAEIVIMSIVESVEKLIVNLDKVYDTFTALEKVNKVLDKEKDIDGPTMYTNYTKGPHIRLRHVSFSFPGDRLILDDVSMEIGSGEKLCITGQNGSGKSTLLKLISGTFNTTSGSIFINDTPIANYELFSLRNAMGIMTGGLDIFEGTIRNNICMGGNNITDEQLYALASVVGLKPFVEECQRGFEHVLKPSGQHLPGRTIKKILLMRALIHKSPMLLLEDPWLGLEPEYEQRIKDYLLNQMQHATIVVVTNDMDFARKCNKTITLSAGTITNITEGNNGRN
jgi:ABC-type bacteriocin/lantibiotic exporter with double-glycine peptidase domain